MSKDMLARLFSPFEQADVTINRSHGGLGLGLALSKRLVELHGGQISGYSEGLGMGSTFVITLPMESAPVLEVKRDAKASVPRRRRVLIVDDNADVAESLGEVLTLKGHQVRIAHSGPEGIETARQFSPEVLLCDIGLPKMNGYEVAKVFQDDPELRHVYLIAITGHAFTEDKRRATAAGFHRHVAKPVDLEELDQILAEADVEKRETGASPLPAGQLALK